MHATRRQDGAVMVEFALVLVPLLLLVLGILQFGLMLNAKIDQTHLTRDGARYAAVNQNPGGGGGSLQSYILAKADTADLATNGIVCVSYPTNSATGTSGKVGDPVRVTMTYTYNLLPFMSARMGVPAAVPINASATMRLEALPTNNAAGCTT